MTNKISDDQYAFQEQWKEIEHRYNPNIVSLQRVTPKAGVLASVEFTVTPRGAAVMGKAPKMYILNRDNADDMQADSIRGQVDIIPGFPQTRPVVSFPYRTALKHINVFNSGKMCIGNSELTVLSVLFDNIIGACIYNPDPSIANYDSPANKDIIGWQRQKEKSGEFPIIDPSKIFAKRINTLPSIKRTNTTAKSNGLPPVHIAGR